MAVDRSKRLWRLRHNTGLEYLLAAARLPTVINALPAMPVEEAARTAERSGARVQKWILR
jgi:hypothetical protein